MYVDDPTSVLRGASNPVRVVADAPTDQIYWGDLHSHRMDSFDGIGWNPFDYARRVSNLDFYTLTDHSRLMTDADWTFVKEATRQAHQPGSFVTLQADQASLPTPYGHHNVFFRETIRRSSATVMSRASTSYGSASKRATPSRFHTTPASTSPRWRG